MPIKDINARREYKRKYNSRPNVKKKQKLYQEKNAKEISERQKKYRENHAEELKIKKKEYSDLHKLEKKEYDKRYNEENKELIRNRNKEYRERNKEKIKEMKKKHANAMAKYDTWFLKLSPYYDPDEIRRDPNNNDLIQFRCYYHECREWFNPTNQQLRIRYTAILGSKDGRNRQCNLYCSDVCKNRCPAFRKRKEPSVVKQDYDREVQPELRKMVLERDNYTCQREGCGKSQKDYPDLVLHCHHKFPLNEDPICSADIDNCITLCAECHKWVHMNVPGCSTAELRCSDNFR